MRLIALVGMPGSGKSVLSGELKKKGYAIIRFGDITDEELKKQNLPVNEENERHIRELLRKENGMDAYAKLNSDKINNAIQKSDVAIDGMRSWEEYLSLKKDHPDMILIAVYCSQNTRIKRLSERTARHLTEEEVKSRDEKEIENMNIAGPIALADYTINNEGSEQELLDAMRKIIGELENE